MNCQDNPHLLQAYFDGELDPMRCLEVEQHLRTCAACSQRYRAMQALRTCLRQEGLAPAMPADLRGQLQASLNAARPAQVEKRRISPFLVFASGIAAAVAVMLAGQWLSQGTSESLVAELTAGHVRSLMAAHLLDVPSSNQHTVKPWFEGKLDFSPPVKDLAAEGFPLAGGRLDYMAGRPVAALAYHCRQHVINLYLWPSDGATPSSAVQDYHGYHLISWHQQGMQCHAVSDLNATDLSAFAQAFQKQ